MQKRGSFTLIATVLVIGFTGAIAAIEMTWGGSFMAKTTEETEVASRTIVKCCSGLDSNIVRTDVQNNRIKPENNGKVDIKRRIFRIHKPTGITTEGINEEPNAFEIKSFSLSYATQVNAIATVLRKAGTDVDCDSLIHEFTIKSTGEVLDQQTGSERGGIRCSGDEAWKHGHLVSPVNCGTLCCAGGRYQMSPACAGQSYYCCAAPELGTEHSEQDQDRPGDRFSRSTFAEVVNGEIWMNGERIRMAGEGCYELISCVFTGWDSPYRILDLFRTLAGENLVYIRASFSGPHDEGPKYVLPVWRDDRERYLSVLEDIINYAKSKNIYIVADLNHEVHGWFENEVGEPDGAIINTSSQSYAL